MSDSEDEAAFANLAAQLSGLAEVEDVMDVTKLSDLDLSNTLEDTRQELLRRNEMLVPVTHAGRELHSLRAALLVEQNKRRHQ